MRSASFAIGRIPTHVSIAFAKLKLENAQAAKQPTPNVSSNERIRDEEESLLGPGGGCACRSLSSRCQSEGWWFICGQNICSKLCARMRVHGSGGRTLEGVSDDDKCNKFRFDHCVMSRANGKCIRIRCVRARLVGVRLRRISLFPFRFCAVLASESVNNWRAMKINTLLPSNTQFTMKRRREESA